MGCYHLLLWSLSNKRNLSSGLIELEIIFWGSSGLGQQRKGTSRLRYYIYIIYTIVRRFQFMKKSTTYIIVWIAIPLLSATFLTLERPSLPTPFEWTYGSKLLVWDSRCYHGFNEVQWILTNMASCCHSAKKWQCHICQKKSNKICLSSFVELM